MSIKHKIKFKNDDRDRGTSPAVLRSSGPKLRPERVATTPGVSGESARRSVPTDDNVFNDKTISDDYKSGGAYKAMLGLFADHVSEEEYLEQELLFYQNNSFNKEDLIKIFELNDIKYSELRNYLIIGISWQKLISGMYYRLTSTSEIEIEEIIMKNPNISKEAARLMIVQKQLDIKSNKMIRDLFNEATIEYK